ncbi:MAG: DUF294 nucleotidyltransferase-like domain-containing protein [Bacteroidetes bacterium]|nr:DUF294 nucleotidyltransferase-like domain-containing protein [Bacteroidota bacterium]MDA1122509.1 DUF294 nucleotidyltransferase-like domain-containing protein [Bacteroidota bacterium]
MSVGGYETFFYNDEGHKIFSRDLLKFSTYGSNSIVFNNGISIQNVEVKKNTIVYRLPIAYFLKLYKTYDAVSQFVVSTFGTLMLDRQYAQIVIKKDQIQGADTIEQLFSQRLNSVSLRPIVTCAPDLPIHNAAQLMEEQRTSCLLIEQGNKIIGFVTDIVLRNEVIAKKRDVDRPISEIMDNPVFRLAQSSYLHEAILMMFNHAIRYMIIENEGEDIGMVSRNDLLIGQGQSPFTFIQSFRMSSNPTELKAKWLKAPEIIHEMSQLGVRAEIVNRVLSSLMDTIVQKVINWVMEKLPEPPVNFAIMAIGNYGREEVMLNTTQKVTVIFEEYDGKYKLEELRSYFLLISERISQSLIEIGIQLPENKLLTDPQKRIKSVSEWRKQYRSWLQNQEITDLYPVFFDIRLIYGDRSLIDNLTGYIQKVLKKPDSKFFSRLADYTLAYNLPITFFRNIKTTTKGDREEFDIYQAIGVLVDFTRYHSLKNQISEANTGMRLKELKDRGIIQTNVFNELMQSFYYLMGMSLKYQAQQVLFDKEPPDNFVDTTNLTTIEMITLKQIFSLIEEFRQGFRNLPLRILGKSREI